MLNKTQQLSKEVNVVNLYDISSFFCKQIMLRQKGLFKIAGNLLIKNKIYHGKGKGIYSFH